MPRLRGKARTPIRQAPDAQQTRAESSAKQGCIAERDEIAHHRLITRERSHCPLISEQHRARRGPDEQVDRARAVTRDEHVPEGGGEDRGSEHHPRLAPPPAEREPVTRNADEGVGDDVEEPRRRDRDSDGRERHAEIVRVEGGDEERERQGRHGAHQGRERVEHDPERAEARFRTRGRRESRRGRATRGCLAQAETGGRGSSTGVRAR